MDKLLKQMTDLMTKNFIWRSIIRHGKPDNFLDQSKIIFTNLFLHVLPVKVRKKHLRTSYHFYLGIISFFLFIILTVTGVFLMFFYIPSTELAYANMKDITYVVSNGDLMRRMHRWGAHGMVLFVMLHMARVFYTGSYKAPRQFNWVIGVVLWLLTIFLSYTGYLLPWDQLAYWAVTIGANISSYGPVVGDLIRFLLLGGNDILQPTLLRFYVLHVFFLPVVAAVIIGLHFWRIRKDGGLSDPYGYKEDK